MSENSFVKKENVHKSGLKLVHPARESGEPREAIWDYLSLQSGSRSGLVLWEREANATVLLSNDPIELRRFVRVILKDTEQDPIIRTGIARIIGKEEALLYTHSYGLTLFRYRIAWERAPFYEGESQEQ
ncbi:hypothetical protein EBZ37_14130 [bacterium]|nr:hypothetical protein [bacterium]